MARLRAAAASGWHSRLGVQLGSQILTSLNTHGLFAGSKMTLVPASQPSEPVPNPLRDYFEANREGPGIWRWQHYFDIYHRHFARFVGREVNVLEIGVYSGGSTPPASSSATRLTPHSGSGFSAPFPASTS